MKQIFTKLKGIISKYGSYKPQAYDNGIVFDDELTSAPSVGAMKTDPRGAEIAYLLEAAVDRANAFVASLPDNNPIQN